MLKSRRNHSLAKRSRLSASNPDGPGDLDSSEFRCVKCNATFRIHVDLQSHYENDRCNSDHDLPVRNLPGTLLSTDHRDVNADVGVDHLEEHAQLVSASADQPAEPAIGVPVHTHMVGLGAPKSAEDILGGFMNPSAFKLALALQKTGASKAALDELLDLFSTPNFYMWHATSVFKSMRVVNALVDSRIAVPFEEHIILLSDGSEYIMYSRDIIKVAMFNFEQNRYVGEMAFRPLQTDPGPNVNLTCLPAASWFKHAYEILWPAAEIRSEACGLLAINLESDASNVTSLVDSTKLVHPVYFSVGNFVDLDKVNALQHREICAMLSLFDKRRHRHNTHEEQRLLKKELFLKCMEKTLDPLILAEVQVLASLGGLHLKPALAMYIADLQEVFKVTSVHAKWCPTCLTPQEEFSSNQCSHARTVPWTLNHVGLARINISNGIWTPEQAEKFLVKKGGIDPILLRVNNPFFSLFPATNIFDACVPDRLHLLEKGICKHVLELIKKSLQMILDGFTKIKKAAAAVTRKFSSQPTYIGLRKVHNIMGDTSATMQASTIFKLIVSPSQSMCMHAKGLLPPCTSGEAVSHCYKGVVLKPVVSLPCWAEPHFSIYNRIPTPPPPNSI